jgi:ABC-type multidrug transport system fused ATPase/permease subunit
MTQADGGGAALRKIYWALPPARRRQAWLAAALMALGGLAEIASVGAVLPFLIILTQPERLPSVPIAGPILTAAAGGGNLVTAGALLFAGLFVLSALVRLVLAWVSQALAFNISYDISVTAFRKIIRQPYSFYINQASSDLISRFDRIHSITYTVLAAGVQAFIASVIAAILVGFLMIVDPAIALVSSIILVGSYVLISLGVRSSLIGASQRVAVGWRERVKWIQEALGGIRDILLDRSQSAFEADFRRTADRLRRALTMNAYIGAAPRILIELLVMILLAGFAWYVAQRPGGITSAIPTLGVLALGAQRLLPLFQTAYVGWSHFRGGQESVIEVAELLDLPETVLDRPQGEAGAFERSITFEDVGFEYLAGRPVLRGISFEVEKGQRIGIVGKTGSGKSTLMDLLLGLLEPSEGRIRIDSEVLDREGRVRWQSQVAHVPQSIYLSDDSIEANIAFGVPATDVDAALVRSAARAAGIHEFIESLPEGYTSRCGERGIRLSGGQRQRIGLARALYKKAKVLVLDEATSALDNETEEQVMRSIAALSSDITIFIIAHRLSTLRGCDRILCLEGGALVRSVESVAELG